MRDLINFFNRIINGEEFRKEDEIKYMKELIEQHKLNENIQKDISFLDMMMNLHTLNTRILASILQNRQTMLHFAVYLNNTNYVQSILENMNDKTLVSSSKTQILGRGKATNLTPLLLACSKPSNIKPEIIELLLKHGADPNDTDEFFQNSLQLFTKIIVTNQISFNQNHARIIENLLEHKVKFDQVGTNSWLYSPLRIAAAHDSTGDITTFLLQKKCYTDAVIDNVNLSLSTTFFYTDSNHYSKIFFKIMTFEAFKKVPDFDNVLQMANLHSLHAAKNIDLAKRLFNYANNIKSHNAKVIFMTNITNIYNFFENHPNYNIEKHLGIFLTICNIIDTLKSFTVKSSITNNIMQIFQNAINDNSHNIYWHISHSEDLQNITKLNQDLGDSSSVCKQHYIGDFLNYTENSPKLPKEICFKIMQYNSTTLINESNLSFIDHVLDSKYVLEPDDRLQTTL